MLASVALAASQGQAWGWGAAVLAPHALSVAGAGALHGQHGAHGQQGASRPLQCEQLAARRLTSTVASTSCRAGPGSALCGARSSNARSAWTAPMLRGGMGTQRGLWGPSQPTDGKSELQEFQDMLQSAPGPPMPSLSPIAGGLPSVSDVASVSQVRGGCHGCTHTRTRTMHTHTRTHAHTHTRTHAHTHTRTHAHTHTRTHIRHQRHPTGCKIDHTHTHPSRVPEVEPLPWWLPRSLPPPRLPCCCCCCCCCCCLVAA
jgi:hypothetical protein